TTWPPNRNGGRRWPITRSSIRPMWRVFSGWCAARNMQNPLDLLLLALATWRLTSLLVQEAGPFRVFQWMRKHIPHGGLLECIWCCSVWCAALLVLVYGYVQWPV